MAGKPKKENDWVSWAVIILLFAMGLWPIALVVLFVKLFKSDDKKKKAAVEPGQANRARAAVNKVTHSPVAKKSNALGLKIGGAVVALAGLMACVEPIDMMIWLGQIESYYVEDLLAALAIMIAGIAMLGSGVSMTRSLKRYNKYLAVLGDRDSMSVEEYARTLGYSERRVEKDLQKMIEKGYFGGKAYLHMELGCLLRSGDAEAAVKQRKAEQQPAPEPARETGEGYSGILRSIRRANDRIADPVLSEKIDRIEEITAKIFQAVEEDPRKRKQIDTFLNYYLPTTQKLLDSYAQFEAAGINGENLRKAKQRIEATMDTIVRGFEHQLDELYHADALDVDSDIRVLETMLRWDTASTEEDFGTGGAAVQTME